MSDPFEHTDVHQHLCENCDESILCTDPVCDGGPVTCSTCLETIGVVTTEDTEERNR